MDAQKKFLMTLHNIIKKNAMIGHQLTNPSQSAVTDELNLTDSELNGLKTLQLTPESISGIEKIVYENLMAAFFEAFCIIDGVGDPDESLMEPNEIWYGLKLSEVVYNEDDDEEEEYREMLHDELYSTYYEWKAARQTEN